MSERTAEQPESKIVPANPSIEAKRLAVEEASLVLDQERRVTLDAPGLLVGRYFAKLAVCTVDAGRHLRAVSISASVAPLLRANASAADSEYLAT